jgi:hypothetical protein
VALGDRGIPQRDPLIGLLDHVASTPTVAEPVRVTLDRVIRKLQAGAAVMAWETVPLATFGSALPPSIASCWVFVIRAEANTSAERHPNSHQRSLSLVGQGEFQLRSDRGWASHPLTSDPDDPMDRRWVSIPPFTWHRLLVGPSPWGMVSFHTVPAADLVEEKPLVPDDLDGPTSQHAYIV